MSKICRLLILLLALHQLPLHASSGDARQHLASAYDLHRQGKTREAITRYTQAIAEHTGCIEAYQMRGAASHKLGQFSKAIADYSKVIELGDKYFKAAGHFNRGTAYFDKGEYNRAIEDFTEAISLDKKMTSAYMHRAIARSRTGDKSGMLEDLEEASSRGDLEARALLQGNVR